MANKVTIDVEARFVDNVTDEAKAAAKSFDNLEKAAEEAVKDVDKLGKANAKPKVTMDSDRAAQKIDKLDKKLNKIGKSKTDVKLSVMDKASAIIDKVVSKAKAFAGRTYSGLVKLRDSNALSTLNKMSNGIKSLTSKAWSVAVKIKDTFTAPLSKLKNMLFNVKTLIAGIASAWAATKLIVNPINVADAYSSAKISFSTLLGESQGQQMMDNLDEFAKATPFNTTNVIGNAQKMLAMGWDPENIIRDMETIGNAAASTGKMDQGLESIVRALSQIKTKGRLSTEELNQLAEAGIAAKAMLAEQLGYGTGDAGIAAMTQDLEEGLIASDVALEALLAGMQKYNGMMDSMANETVDGLMAQIQDAFNINVVRRWGQGLQDGAKQGFGTLVTLLDEAEGSLAEVGDLLYETGKTASHWAADKFQKVVEKIREITDTFEFQDASLGEKISMLWKGVIADPFKEWFSELWTSEENIQKATDFGRTLAEGLTKGILTVLGLTDIFGEGGLDESKGSNIAQGFAKGFVDGFDVSAITDKLVEAIGNVWGALPTWAKILIGGYGIGKAAGGISNFAGGVANFIGGASNFIGSYAAGTGLIGAIGSTGNYMVSGTGILGKLAGAGYALTGGPASAGAYFGAGMSGGAAALIGSAGVAGGVAGAASLLKGGIDLYKGYTTDDEVEASARKTSGWSALGGVGAGAGIGFAVGGPLGALIGAGIGGIGGWLLGNHEADKIRATDDAINDVSAAVADLENEEEKLKAKNKMVWQNMRDHFGDIKLSMSEVQRLAEQIVWGNDLGSYEKFASATQAAAANLQALNDAGQKTDRWMWKAGLGVTFNDDEIDSIIASFEEYVGAAQAYVENKHYQFSAAVEFLVDVESENGQSIIASGNALYSMYQKKLEDAGTELGNLLTEAVADGFINADEQKAITAAQKKIASITQRIADAETTAELELIDLKFGGGKLDPESFNNFMAQIQTTLDERMTANDEAFKVAVSALELELHEGVIDREEYEAQLQALVDGYTTNVDSIKARILGVELDIIGEAYADDGVTAEKLKNALERSLKDGIDPISWTPEEARNYLGLPELSESSALAIAEMLGSVSDQLELVEVDGQLLLKLGITTEGAEPETVQGVIDGKLPDTVDEDIAVRLRANSQIMNTFEFSGRDFGIRSSYLFSPTVTVNPTLRTTSRSFRMQVYEGAGYRGGIFGGSFARGGIPGFNGMTDEGGIVGGSTRFIRVNEESPEMVIPLSSQRRGRGLKLWAQAGNIMGVPGFARGGIVGGDGSDEGIRFQNYGSGNEPAGGRTVQVNMGGVTFEINVNGSDKEGIAEAIKAQAGELADYFVGLIADALETEFENTPVRGGAT